MSGDSTADDRLQALPPIVRVAKPLCRNCGRHLRWGEFGWTHLGVFLDCVQPQPGKPS